MEYQPNASAFLLHSSTCQSKSIDPVELQAPYFLAEGTLHGSPITGRINMASTIIDNPIRLIIFTVLLGDLKGFDKFTFTRVCFYVSI